MVFVNNFQLIKQLTKSAYVKLIIAEKEISTFHGDSNAP